MLTSRVSEHFSIQEVQITAHRNVDNTLPEVLVPNVLNTAKGMERVRACLGDRPISINSWYRCQELNRALGSKDTSQHRKGQAVDFICPAYGTPLDIVRCLHDNQVLIRFDQLILEHTWVHISFVSPTEHARGQVLTLLSNGGYAVGITGKDGTPI